MRVGFVRRLAVAAAVPALVLSGLAGAVRAQQPGPGDPDDPPPPYQINLYGPSPFDNVVLLWDEELLQAIRANPAGTGPTVTARALGVVHTAMYDAWAAYDPKANGTRYGGSLRRPPAEHTVANKSKAISFAAYATLVDLFPKRKADFGKQMEELGYSPIGIDNSTPATIGLIVAKAIIDFRHNDGANQLGDYADTTGYQPVNTWDKVNDRWRWQPLCVPTPPPGAPTCEGTVQKAYTPHWRKVIPFVLTWQPLRYDVPGPPTDPGGGFSTEEVEQAMKETADLDDVSKIKAEYWADGPQSEFPPGHWAVFAQAASRKRRNSLDDDAKLFFALGNALMDASISSWAAKYQYDYIRPVCGIRIRYKDKLITSWLGPGKGYGKVLGQHWQPYQEPTVVTPPFPEYVSGHSTFSGAGAVVIAYAFGNNGAFNAKVTIPAGSSKIEPNITPAKNVVLYWKTLDDASDEAGWSRRWGGIHYETGDMHGRGLGKTIGYNAWTKALTYFNGTATATT